jgi:hypothetical protein
MPAGAPTNRLGLVKWLIHADHPLTARVAVNRAWASCFGRGLVATAEDFGSQGEMPAHPQLLDWLARDFQDAGWDWGFLLKKIVLSSAYRQSSSPREDLQARDPVNRLLARGPRHRLSAEQIRDSALAASGLLVRKIGGEGVKPYQPDGLWEDAGTGKKYDRSKGEGLYRRSLYTFLRRTMPPPSMSTFDAPTREFCKARREITTTPLQALQLLNDPQYLETSRFLAASLLQQGLEPAAFVEQACRRLLGRRPLPAESAALQALLEQQRTWYKNHAGEAASFVAIGEHTAGRHFPADELAAATVTVSAILNMDEFVVKR